MKLDINHGLKVGDTVMAFTPEESDYDANSVDGTFQTILEVANIKTGNRPRMFKVTAVSGRDVTIGGLVFSRTYTASGSEWLSQAKHTSITILRVTSFNDDGFKGDGYVKYSANRSYAVDALDYDVFYDVMLNAGTYSDNLQPDDYDVWYVSNEIFDENGVEVDHGYYQPIYGKGVLSELVRAKVIDSLQIFVYEYDVDTISPVLTDGIWSYSKPVVDKIYIESESKVTVITNDSVENMTYVSKPTQVGEVSLDGSVVNGVDRMAGDIISLNDEQMLVRSNGNVLRAVKGTAEIYYSAPYLGTGLNLGKEDKMDVYANNYPVIPLSTYSSSLEIAGTVLPTLLK